MSNFDYMSLLMINPRVIVNEIRYCEMLLTQKLLSGEVIFRQDSSPTYRSC